MTLSTILYFISVVLAFVLTGFLAWYAWWRTPLPGGRAYAGLALGECLLALDEILCMTSLTQAQAHFWFNLRFLFTGTIAVLFLIFALEYLGRKDWLTKPLLAGAFIIPALTQLIIWTNRLSGLWVKRDVGFYQSGPFWITDTSVRIPAVWFLVHSLYSFALLLAGMVVILLAAWRIRREQRGQAVLLAAGALVALVTGLIPVFNLIPQLNFNPFIPGIGVSALLYALAIFRFRFLKRSPVQENAGSSSPNRLVENHSLALFIFIFILFTTGVAAIGFVSYKNYEGQFRLQVDKQLTAISALKVSQLESWRSERLGDAEMIYRTPAFSALVGSFLVDPGNTQTGTQLQAWLDAVRTAQHYERVFLLDTHGVERLASPNPPAPVSAYLAGQAVAALGLGQVTFMDFYRDTPSGPVYISLLVPVYAGGDRSRPLGVLVLRVDPALSLYPFIQEWPSSSSTAETLLVRRDGNNALFLNELRFEKNTALNMRIPLEDTQVLAVKAILGQTGIVSGVDYRGLGAVGYVSSVPGSPWFLVTRMDLSEVYAPLRERLWEMLVFFGVLILAAGAGLLLLWRQQGVRYYRAQAAVAQALRDSELRYRRLFEAARDGILILDAETGVVADVNPFLVEMLGFPRAEIVGKELWELGFFKDIAASQANFLELQQKEYVRYEDLPLETADGRKFYVEFVSNVYQVDHHKVVQCNIRDITKRKQAEEKLAQEQYLLHTLMENLPDHIYFKDRASRFTKITQSHARQFGLNDPAEALGKTDFDFYTEEHARPAFEVEQKIIATGQPVIGLEEKETWQKDGRVTWVKTTKMPLLDQAGHIIGTFGISSDITERKGAEETLRESESRFHSLFENMLNGFAYCQMLIEEGRPLDFIYLDVNRTFGTLTGLKDVTDKKVSEVIPGIQESDPQLLERYARVSQTGLPESFETYVEGLKMWFSISVYSPQKGYFVAVFDVITDRKRAEQELQAYSEYLEEMVNERTRALQDAQEKMVRQERLATLGQLAGSVGHELRNPLGVISNAVYFLKMTQPDANETILDYLDIIEKETRTSDKIVTDLLDFTRIKSVDREPADVSDLIHQTLRRYPVPAAVEVQLDLPAGLPPVYADMRQVVQVLGNLVTNACQAISLPDGAPLAGKLTLSASRQGDMIAIAVQDTGMGIPPENMGKLFEPLFTTKTKGIGLGLAVSQKLAEANGGRVEARSTLGQGSTFTVYLPVYQLQSNSQIDE